MNKIKKGDQVVVITGKDKGKRGTVLSVLGELVVVEQNIDGGAASAQAARGRAVRLVWPREHTQIIGIHGE